MESSWFALSDRCIITIRWRLKKGGEAKKAMQWCMAFLGFERWVKQ
jgi:hypothetical protein